ncbi:hypothetical protein CP533_2405 [Ophiocordyceps camponoti-saundersi (nom. inval.)]|nr:hypothetical protein CP533_2405 [Ophiocordyceps camponoti-saundersi (nom. inval.)]
MASSRQAGKGASRPKDGNIMSFFKPKSQPQTSPRPMNRPRSPMKPPVFSNGPLSPAPPSSLPPSSTSTPSKPPGSEIPASDESGDDSDDSLQDLSTLMGRRPSPATASKPPKPQYDPYSTPRAKRIAVQFEPSPVAFMPKLKFDLKSLAEDARREDATTASSIRVKESAAAADADAKQAASSRDHATSDDAFVEIVKERGGADAPKVLRAVQRSDPGLFQQRFCLFTAEYLRPASAPPPKSARSGPWRLLAQGTLRAKEQHLAAGVPQMAVRKMKSLPDELLQWILDELCIQESIVVREGYCHLVADCQDEQVARIVTPQRLRELFVRLGARQEHFEKPCVESIKSEPYQDRDWSALQSFLLLLAAISRALSGQAVQFALKTLLLMSMDSFLLHNPDVLMRFCDAVQSLVDTIPSSSWVAFCLETSASLSAGHKNQTIRANALLCLPLSSSRLHDLRRRLAIAFLFDEISVVRERADHASVAIRDFIDVLDDPGFDITLETDFSELKSRILILDMAIDDGSAVSSRDQGDEVAFNDDVDRVAQKLGEIWRRINDSGMKLARTETKSVVEWVQQRLLHSVRTRRKVKKSVFDLCSQESAFDLQRQQHYMSNFLRKAATQTAGEESRTASEVVDDET